MTDDAGATGSTTTRVTVTAPPNTPPVADFTATSEGLDADFDARRPPRRRGLIASWAWSFGDGATKTGKTVSHRFAAAGDYDVTLTVHDAAGAEATVTHTGDGE